VVVKTLARVVAVGALSLSSTLVAQVAMYGIDEIDVTVSVVVSIVVSAVVLSVWFMLG
jgi:hypothetical protein